MYLGGEDILSTATLESDRHVIDFSGMEISEVMLYPDLFGIIVKRVKPEREQIPENSSESRLRDKWWLYRRSAGYNLSGLTRCLVAPVYPVHLTFAFQSTERAFNNKLSVFGFDRFTSFSVLQSRVHTTFALRLSPTRGAADSVVYAPTECFLTFPFPQPDPRTVIPALEDIGERLYTTRAKYMVDTNQGLTQTYNALKDPRVTEARVVELRRLHEEMDRAVLAAYGWDDLAVPPYGTPTTEAEKKALARFEDEVIDRLFALNAQRAEEERAAAAREEAAKPAKAKGGRKKGDAGSGGAGSGQGTLGIG